ncbi:MAG: carbohydrate esterase, partial [Duncaniella sp.]|nr:carbohydrate esterase [Duncaniella sp.]
MKRILSIAASAALALGLSLPVGAKKVHTIGDSTMANYDENATVTRGWCQYLQQFLTGIDVNNRAKNGASSKSFYK